MMLHSPVAPAVPRLTVQVHAGREVDANVDRLAAFALGDTPSSLSRHPRWLPVLRDGLGYDAFALEAVEAGVTTGYLPLAHVSSLLFGRFLVSLPFLSSNGVQAETDEAEAALIDRAVTLARELGVRYLELRHERPTDHPAIPDAVTHKVHMRLALPDGPEKLWKALDAKVRNQVRKGEKSGLAVEWGGLDKLDAFHDVIARNMRDLGSPVYGKPLFREIVTAFAGEAELCVVRSGETPVAAALLLHGPGVTEVPVASSLRAYNSTCANMLMYRHLLDRAIERRQDVFDFGRSTVDGPTFKFKKQWGAETFPATWQYHIRRGRLGEMRPENPRYARLIGLWRRLPLGVTRVLGPRIVRGIP